MIVPPQYVAMAYNIKQANRFGIFDMRNSDNIMSAVLIRLPYYLINEKSRLVSYVKDARHGSNSETVNKFNIPLVYDITSIVG